MKKLISLFLALCLLCGATAFAATIDQNSENHSVDTPVTLNLEGSGYTVTIPTAINFDPNPIDMPDQDEYTQGHVYYKAEDMISVDNKTRQDLVIYTGSANNWQLEAEGQTIVYTFECYTGDGESIEVLYEGNNEMVVYSNGHGEFNLIFTTDSSTVDGFPAGEFTDTLTFTVALEG